MWTKFPLQSECLIWDISASMPFQNQIQHSSGEILFVHDDDAFLQSLPPESLQLHQLLIVSCNIHSILPHSISLTHVEVGRVTDGCCVFKSNIHFTNKTTGGAATSGWCLRHIMHKVMVV
jgi:hypothetical protein